MKRTHRKVRTGCDTCRLRRIKCDELRPVCSPCRRLAANHGDRSKRCSFVTADQATETGILYSVPVEQVVSAATILSPMDPSTSLAASEYGWPKQLSDMDRRLLHHACTVNAVLSAIVQSGHVTGITQIAKYLAMAKSCEHVRHAVCAVAAAHLCTLTHSAEISRVEVKNRMLAMRGMSQQLQNKQPGRIVALDNHLEEMIASSTLLGWNAPCGNEYAALLKGVIALKNELRTSKKDSGPAQSAKFLVTDSNIRQNFASSEAIDDDMLLEALGRSVHRLSKCSLDSEVRAGVRELQCFIHNIGRLLRSKHSLEDQLSASWPIRNWLRLIPRGHTRLAADDSLVLLYLANYDMVMWAMCKRLPLLGAGLSVDDRSTSVVRMREVIDDEVAGIKDDSSGTESGPREEQKRLIARQAWDHGWEVCQQFLLGGFEEVQ